MPPSKVWSVTDLTTWAASVARFEKGAGNSAGDTTLSVATCTTHTILDDASHVSGESTPPTPTTPGPSRTSTVPESTEEEEEEEEADYPESTAITKQQLTADLAAEIYGESYLVRRGYHILDEATYRSRRCKHPFEEVRSSPRRRTRRARRAKRRGRRASRPKRAVVAINTDAVGVDGGLSEVVRVCAVDVLTDEVLVDLWVQPYATVRSWRTRWSKATPAVLKAARREGKLVKGWDRARAAVWRFVDKETILVGHALHASLEVLRLRHARCVDTLLMTWEASCRGENRRNARMFPLDVLAWEFADVKIPKAGHPDRCALQDCHVMGKVAIALVTDRPHRYGWCCGYAQTMPTSDPIPWPRCWWHGPKPERVKDDSGEVDDGRIDLLEEQQYLYQQSESEESEDGFWEEGYTSDSLSEIYD